MTYNVLTCVLPILIIPVAFTLYYGSWNEPKVEGTFGQWPQDIRDKLLLRPPVLEPGRTFWTDVLDALWTTVQWSFGWWSERFLPMTSGVLHLKYINETITITRNDLGVPHISGKTDVSVLFGQGFLVAQDRLFQMEMSVRAVRGTMSEVLGPRAVSADKFLRCLQLKSAAHFTRRKIKAEPMMYERQLIEAFVHGINAGIEHTIDTKRIPVEMRLLGLYNPTRWDEEDVIGLGKFLAFKMSRGWTSELVNAMILALSGQEGLEELAYYHDSTMDTVMPPRLQHSRAELDLLLHELGLSDYLESLLVPSGGSNGWAVSGAHTTSGHPILAGDPHLTVTLPSSWYEISMTSDQGLELAGLTVPGVPCILMGRNKHVIFTPTLSFFDGEDLFEEVFDAASFNIGAPRYLFNGTFVHATVKEEIIQVKNVPQDVIMNLYITHHGPVISTVYELPAPRYFEEDFIDGIIHSVVQRQYNASQHILLDNKIFQVHDGHVMLHALASLPLEDGHELVFDMLRAVHSKNIFELRDNFRRINGAFYTMIMADVHGNIGYATTGCVPYRSRPFPLVSDPYRALPRPGTGEYEWSTCIPASSMPSVINPVDGYVVAANNRIWTRDDPLYFATSYMNPYRATVIANTIRSKITKSQYSLEDARAAQLSTTSIPGKLVQDILSRCDLACSSPEVATALEVFKSWDCEMTANSAGAALYTVFKYYVGRLLFVPRFGTELSRIMFGSNPSSIAPPPSTTGLDVLCMIRILQRGNSSLFVREVGGIEHLLDLSLSNAVKFLTAQFGPKPDYWNYGKLRPLYITHPFHLAGTVGKSLSAGPFYIGGDPDTPLCHGESPLDTGSWTVSARMLADVEDSWSRVGINIAGGSSGQYGSTHYTDQVDEWLRGCFHNLRAFNTSIILPLVCPYNNINNKTEDTLLLMPIN